MNADCVMKCRPSLLENHLNINIEINGTKHIGLCPMIDEQFVDTLLLGPINDSLFRNVSEPEKNCVHSFVNKHMLSLTG